MLHKREITLSHNFQSSLARIPEVYRSKYSIVDFAEEFQQTLDWVSTTIMEIGLQITGSWTKLFSTYIPVDNVIYQRSKKFQTLSISLSLINDRIRIYVAVVRIILVYGCEIRPIRGRKIPGIIFVFYHSSLKCILSTHKVSHMVTFILLSNTICIKISAACASCCSSSSSTGVGVHFATHETV